MIFTVYELFSIKTGKGFYVGITSKKPKRRLRGHIQESRSKKSNKAKFIRKLLNGDLSIYKSCIGVRLIEKISVESWRAALDVENEYIRRRNYVSNTNKPKKRNLEPWRRM